METRITTKTSAQNRVGGKELKSSDTSACLLSLFFLRLLSWAQILQGQISTTYYFMFVSFTHPLVFALDSFRGCSVNCLLLSLLWFCSLLTSSIPSLIYLSSLYYKGTGSRRCTNSCTQCRFSSNLLLTFHCGAQSCQTHLVQHVVVSSLCRFLQNSRCFGFLV